MANGPTTSTKDRLPDGAALETLASTFHQFYDEHLLEFQTPDGAKGLALVAPQGRTAQSLAKFADEYRGFPLRRKGIANHAELASLVAYVNRFKDADSVVFAWPNEAKPQFIAVIDHHQVRHEGEVQGGDGPRPRFGEHRAHYDPPLSPEWKAWIEHNGAPMDQGEFAEFLEDRIGDVIVPPTSIDDDPALKAFVELVGGRFAAPTKLLELSRGLAINVEEKVKNAVVLGTGEISVVYEQTHRDGGGQPITVPNLFLLAIPVFRAGPIYRIPVRLRYRLLQGVITWTYALYRPELTFDHAFGEMCKAIETGTGLPVFVGTPER